MITLDTNILIYAIDFQAGGRNEIAQSVIDGASIGDCVLTLQALGEFSNVILRKELAEA